MDDYHQIVRVCCRCGKSYYKKATTQTQAWKQLNIILRCHDKKCTGRLNLTDEEIGVIIQKELYQHGASDRKTCLILESYKADDGEIISSQIYSGRRGTIQ